MRIKKYSSDYIEDEFIDTPPTEIIEEDIYLEEDEIKNKSLIRMDMNLAQYPIFSKNTRRKVNQVIKYYFNKNRDTYIAVTPAAGNHVPGELEEKVFLALMKIMKNRGMPRRFIVNLSELKNELRFNTTRYVSLIREAITRLATTSYAFKNTMYSSEKKSILTEEIKTYIMAVRIINLREKKNEVYRREINDDRIKEVYEISISDHFFNNIMKKGYLVYDYDILLDINTSTARTIYMLIEKLRFNNIYLKIDTMFLIKRIPLKYTKHNMLQTVKVLESNLNELKSKQLIKDFFFVKDTTWEKSEIEIFFEENSIDHKQKRFYEDLNDFRKLSTELTISETEHEIVPKIDEDIIVTNEMLAELFRKLPKKAQTLKSMAKTIKDSVERYGYRKVKAAVLYLSKQKKLTSPRAYFLKTLEHGWARDEIVEPEIEIKIEPKKIKDEENYEREKKYYEALSIEQKYQLEMEVYDDYIKMCGQNSQIQQKAFSMAKTNLILKYIKKTFIEDFTKPQSYIKSDVDFGEYVVDLKEFDEYIKKSIEMYKMLLKLSDEKVLEMKKEILSKLGRKFITKALTFDEIDNTIKKLVE